MYKTAKKLTALVLGLSMLACNAAGLSENGIFTAARVAKAEGETLTITGYGALNESVYAEWEPVEGADGYIVYYKSNDDAAAWQKADNELIRRYSDCWRVDIPGLSAGDWRLRVEADTKDGSDYVQLVNTNTPEMSVKAYDRTGFAAPSGNGAYSADGTLKSNADVVYITQTNKNTVSFTPGGSDETYTGLADIVNNYLPTATRPLDIRIIGMITAAGDFKKYSDWKGDLYIAKGSDVTIEGIGKDAVAYGWGIRTGNGTDIEIRNLGFLNTASTAGDCIGLEGSSIWVHNCDFFYGAVSGSAIRLSGADAVTLSYNYFHDTAESMILGEEGSYDGVGRTVTIHHNRFDHSDGANPLVCGYSAHVYNNLFDGNSCYSLEAAMNASVFAQNNYFTGCTYPMLIAGQGSYLSYAAEEPGNAGGEAGTPALTGGIIKSTGNKISGSTIVPYGEAEGESTSEFDAVVISTASSIVANTIKSKSGSYTYNNFDTASGMYDYTADTAMETPVYVKLYAGRCDGGDLSWEFTSKDNSSSTPNAELKKLVEEYDSTILSIGGLESDSCAKTYLVEFDSQGGTAVPDMKISSGDVTTLDQTTTREGYTFKGWYTKAQSGEEVKVLDGGTLTEDIILYAHWTEKSGGTEPDPDPENTKVTVKFVYEDGTPVSGISDQSVELGGHVTKPEDPVLENATFFGWYNGTTPWDFENDTVISNLTLTARFDEEERYFILLEDEDGDLGEDVILEYTGEARTPAVSVCYGTTKSYKKLTPGTDYTVSYKNNKTANLAHYYYADGVYDDTHPEYEKLITDSAKLPVAIIKFKGNYTGTVYENFGIAKRIYEVRDHAPYSIKGGKALLYTDSSEGAAAVDSVAYTGSPIKFESIKLTLPASAGEFAGETVEAVGSDQFSVSYLKNTAKGTATVLISGTGDVFEGTVKRSFKILPADIGGAEGLAGLELGYCYATYAKGGAKPSLSLTYGPESVSLTEGKDYTLSCKDNKAVTAEDGMAQGKKPTVTIKGKGNFAGSVTYNFKIMQADLSDMKISSPDVVFSDGKGKFASKITVTENCLKGKKLAENKDYSLEFYLCDESGIKLSEEPLDRKTGRVS